MGGKSLPSYWSAYLSGCAVTQELAGGSTRAVPVLVRLDPVDENVLVAVCLLYPSPFIGWQVVGNLARQGLNSVDIVDDDVSRQPLTQGPTILEAGCPSHQATQAEVSLF